MCFHGYVLKILSCSDDLTHFLPPGCGPDRWAGLRKMPFFTISQQNCNNSTHPHQKMLPLPYSERPCSTEVKEIMFCALGTTWTTGPDQSGPLFWTLDKCIDIGII